ncbi:Rop guanine nucleotide exchange factor 1 [Porphyridium purpureum]|uniref:Rop guanine nucleotide exchange factor 1 n=1 Tax=Porphyridium purpureum TaxID=35688 RepID=A0A5J4YR46_PORPP|nr:Rop guanine nucleotide exchange factor 1 [Porphyridium purpureum]|eukprot:POR8927..scf296_7
MSSQQLGSGSSSPLLLKDYMAQRFMAGAHAEPVAAGSKGAAKQRLDTFDFEGFMHYPASSDPSTLLAYKAQMMHGEVHAQPATEPIYTAALAMKVHATDLTKPFSVTECHRLVQKSVDLAEAENYEDAYACLRLAVDMSLSRLPHLSGEKHREQEVRILALIRRMEQLKSIVEEQNEVSTETDENKSFPMNDGNSANAELSTKRSAAHADDMEWLNSSLGSIRESKQTAAPDKERRNTGGGNAAKSTSSLHRKKSSTHSLTKEEMSDDIENLKRTLLSVITGGDMSGAGGASTAYQMSMMITNASYETFGEMKRLQSPSPELQAKWAKQTRLLVFETLEKIVEKRTVTIEAPGGEAKQVSRSVLREDIGKTLPILREIDGKIRDMMQAFDATVAEVTYTKSSEQSCDSESKWWVERPAVPSGGLSKQTRMQLETWHLECRRMQE